MRSVKGKIRRIFNVARPLYVIAACILTLCLPDTSLGEEESISIRAEVPPTERPRLPWGKKDPFVPLVPTGAQPGVEAAAELKLTAIFFNKDKPSAIINDRIVYVGSLIRGQKIVDIGKTHVILQNKDGGGAPSGNIRLEFTGPPEAAPSK